MPSKTSLLALAASLFSSVNAGFSTTVWNTNRPNNTASPIIYLETTLKVPPLPSSEGTFLWPGLYTHDDQLVQTILVNDPQYRCSSQPGWCVQSYQYSGHASTQGIGPAHPVHPGELLHMRYSWDAEAGNMTQCTTNLRTGQVLTEFSWPGGPGFNLANSIECHQNVNWIPEHFYYNTTIVLERENRKFNRTLQAVNSGPKRFESADCGRGKKWFVEKIRMGGTGCRCNEMGSC